MSSPVGDDAAVVPPADLGEIVETLERRVAALQPVRGEETWAEDLSASVPGGCEPPD
jgi:hypothetical protein